MVLLVEALISDCFSTFSSASSASGVLLPLPSVFSESVLLSVLGLLEAVLSALGLLEAVLSALGSDEFEPPLVPEPAPLIRLEALSEILFTILEISGLLESLLSLPLGSVLEDGSELGLVLSPVDADLHLLEKAPALALIHLPVQIPVEVTAVIPANLIFLVL